MLKKLIRLFAFGRRKRYEAIKRQRALRDLHEAQLQIERWLDVETDPLERIRLINLRHKYSTAAIIMRW